MPQSLCTRWQTIIAFSPCLQVNPLHMGHFPQLCSITGEYVYIYMCVCGTSITTGYGCVIRTYNQTCTMMLSAKDSQADPIGKFAKTGKAIPCRLYHCWLSHFGKSPHCWQIHIQDIKIYIYMSIYIIYKYSSIFHLSQQIHQTHSCGTLPICRGITVPFEHVFFASKLLLQITKESPAKKNHPHRFYNPIDCPWFGYAVVIKHGSLENPQTKWRT